MNVKKKRKPIVSFKDVERHYELYLDQIKDHKENKDE